MVAKSSEAAAPFWAFDSVWAGVRPPWIFSDASEAPHLHDRDNPVVGVGVSSQTCACRCFILDLNVRCEPGDRPRHLSELGPTPHSEEVSLALLLGP